VRQLDSLLREAGCISSEDMTVEATISKLSFLLGQDYSVEQVKELMQTSLRGEITNSKK
jgi:L-asparaginase